MKQREKIGLTLVLVALGMIMSVAYNSYVGGTTIRYDVPLNIGESTAAINAAIDAVLKVPEISALADAKPSRIIATQNIMAKGEGYLANGTMTSHSTTIIMGPGPNADSVYISNVYSVVVVTILYTDQSGYYVVYDSNSGTVGAPIFSQNVLQTNK